MKIALILALISFLLSFFGATFPGRTNAMVVQALSQVTGLVPFSLFEWLIYSLVAYLLWRLGSVSVLLCRKKFRAVLNQLKEILTVAALLYSAFVLLWGLNYNNPPLHERLGLIREPRPAQELAQLGRHLAQRANLSREDVLENADGTFKFPADYRDVFQRAPLGFHLAAEEFYFLGGRFGLPKPILASNLLTHTFITGIYSPFTGEANVNTHVPPATLIFTTMHEIAHQRGIAREDEANFIAFLTSIRHPDPDFRYAGYLNALNYVRRALATTAPPYLEEINSLLSDGVRRDINAGSAFWNQYRGRAQEVASRMNDNYLRFNGVREGVLSYGLVVDLLLAYYEAGPR